MNLRKLFLASSDNFIAELKTQEPNFISLETACKMDAGFPTYTAKMFAAVLSVEKTPEKSKFLAHYLIAQLQHHIGNQIDFIPSTDPVTFSIRFKKPLDIRALLHNITLEGSQIEIQAADRLKITLHNRTKFSAIFFVAQQFKTSMNKESVINPLLTDLFQESIPARPRL